MDITMVGELKCALIQAVQVLQDQCPAGESVELTGFFPMFHGGVSKAAGEMPSDLVGACHRIK